MPLCVFDVSYVIPYAAVCVCRVFIFKVTGVQPLTGLCHGWEERGGSNAQGSGSRLPRRQRLSV